MIRIEEKGNLNKIRNKTRFWLNMDQTEVVESICIELMKPPKLKWSDWRQISI